MAHQFQILGAAMLKRTLITLSIAVAAMPAILAAQDDLRVEFVTAETEALLLDLQLSGTIEAKDSVDLGFRQSGRVTDVLIEEGDEVVAGQPLARLDPVQQDQGLRVAEASLAAASATEEQARQASERADAMLARGVGTRAARDDARQALSEAIGAVQRAESNVEQARRAVEDTVLRAPVNSVITQRDMAPGQIVGAAQSVVSLANLDGLEAVFRSPDHPLLNEAMGAAVRLDTLDIDMPAMTGTVTEIAPLVDPASGTVTVRARIDDVEPGTTLLGAAVRGTLRISSDAAVVVPWTALTRQGRDAAVWVVGEGNKVSLTPVQISHFGDEAVFLSGGVESGQTVVGAGSQLLYPDRTVQPAPETAEGVTP